MLLKQIYKSPFFFSLAVFLLAVILINPLGEFVINDDWLFSRQVLAFSLGNFQINSQIDPVFILQGLLGYGWISIFGFSHSALRVLTLLITVGAAYTLDRILLLFNSSGLVRKITLLIFFFNPLVLNSAFSFMTENYFLFFYLVSLYFYLKFLKSGGNKNLFVGSLFVGASFLVRQIGFLTFLAILPLIYRESKENKADFLKSSFVAGLPVFIALLIFVFWPRYSSGLTGILTAVAPLQTILNRWFLDLFSFSYIAYFLFPLLFIFPLQIKSFKAKVLLLAIFVLLAIPVYKFNIFPLGSVLYLEGLHIKSYAHENFSIFDNIPFKIFIASTVSFSLSYLLYSFWRKGRIYLEKYNIFLILTFIFNLLIIFSTNDFYDRYLLVPFVALLILTVVNLFELYEPRNSVLKYIPFFATILFIFISFSLQEDFFLKTRLGWQQAKMLSEKYHLQTNIYLLGPYEKYQKAVKDDDFSGYNDSPTGDYQCYVYDYTLDTNSKILNYGENINHQLSSKLIKNPEIYHGRKPQNQPKIKNNLDKLEINQEYISPLYNIVGKKAFVGSFCPPKD